MIEFVAALGATKTGLDLVKGARKLLKGDKVEKAQMDSRLSELQAALYQAREALGDAQEEVRKLNHQIDELRRAADIGKDFKFEEGMYWLKGFPYCPTCWDIDRKPVRLGGPTKGPNRDTNIWTCAFHNSAPYTTRWSFKPSVA